MLSWWWKVSHHWHCTCMRGNCNSAKDIYSRQAFYFVYTCINFLVSCLYICFVFIPTHSWVSLGVEVFTLEQKIFQPLFLPSGAWSIEVTLKAGNGIHAINHWSVLQFTWQGKGTMPFGLYCASPWCKQTSQSIGCSKFVSCTPCLHGFALTTAGYHNLEFGVLQQLLL